MQGFILLISIISFHSIKLQLKLLNKDINQFSIQDETLLQTFEL